MSDPVERELMPGVFVTDFRNSNSTATSAQANIEAAANLAVAVAAAESKSKEQAEADDNDEEEADDAAANGGGAAAASSSRAFTAAVPRPPNAAFPLDIPNDVEELELELAALEKNMAQLIKSNAVLIEELKEDPEEQVRRANEDLLVLHDGLRPSSIVARH
jgi:hypothetical protein